MKTIKIFLFIVLLLEYQFNFAQSLYKGFEAIDNHDTYTAKQIFLSNFKKNPTVSSYGLALVFEDSLSHFHSLDSANKYGKICIDLLHSIPPKSYQKIEKKHQIDTDKLILLKNRIELTSFKRAKLSKGIKALIIFNSSYPNSIYQEEANRLIHLRAYQEAKLTNTWQALDSFVRIYPNALQISDAIKEYDALLFSARTADNSIASFEKFIVDYPQSPYKKQAEKLIYQINTIEGSIEQYHSFVRRYPLNPYIDSAWKNIYELYVNEYIPEKLTGFRNAFPDYPNLEQVLQDDSLSRITLLPFLKNNLYGFADTSGKILIAPKFSWADEFYDGFSLIEENDKFGYINKLGKWIVIPIYDEGEKFGNGLAVVKLGEFYGAVNRQGKTIIPFKYKELLAFKDGIAAACLDSLWGFINSEDSWQIIPQFQSVQSFKNGLSIIKKNNLYGVIDLYGKHVLQTEFSSIRLTEENNFSVVKNEKHGVYNLNGNVIVACDYDRIWPFSEGFARVELNNKSGIVNNQGEIILKVNRELTPKSEADHLIKNKLFIQAHKDKFGLMNLEGKWIVLPEFEDINLPQNGIVAVKKKGKWGLRDSKLKVIMPHVSDKIIPLKEAWLTQKATKYSYFTKQFKNSDWDIEAELLRPFNDFYLIKSENEKLGLIDLNGQIILPSEWDEITEVFPNIIRLKNKIEINYFNLSAKKLLIRN